MKKFPQLLKRVFSREDMDIIFAVVIGEENMACITNAYKQVTSEFCKHIENKYQLLVDYVEKGDVGLSYVATDEMIAVMFTKNLKRTKFNELIELSDLN